MYELNDADIKQYLVKKYQKISEIVINCVIIQTLITQQVLNGFKNKIDAFETVESCAYMYINNLN